MTTKIKFISNLIPNKLHDLIIDVGCDHGYLSLILIQENKSKVVLNIDNKKKPLMNAIKNTSKYEYRQRIFNVLNEGLNNLPSYLSPNYIVIAGIGTNNIINILENEHVSNSKTKFIFQSEGNIVKLKDHLTKNNFKILLEKEIVIKNKVFNFIISSKQNNNL
ncbi:tRNA (adenine(22)-N(1))-methyltransferase TrmK [Mycoplasmoides alvi]|uniref:tRNA (adenine(22)-N(1))-methyltransferase TrmK n=1 Tax=Mycoplasmoides alvi TaxID=78580 RepID=UPI0006985E42|nr:tRNA (adenine(22)-N(1))-methyltransferase TrmK [Mycoplasmoides alvi]